MNALLRPMRISRDWAYALGFTAMALALRLWHLSTPKGQIFDEIYYAKNANSLLLHGVEIDPATNKAEFIVHPPVGKWLIAIGIKLFGYNEFGWRSIAALVGALSVTLMYFTAKRLFENRFLSCAAAFLILVDGLHLVHSRVALLDIFLMFFIQIAVLAFLNNKYWLTGVALGLAAGTKWSGLYFIIAFALLTLVIDFFHQRYLGVNRPLVEVFKQSLIIRFFQFGLLPVIVYLFTWIGWFLTGTGWDRHWSKDIVRSFWHYHYEILNFHSHLSEKHPYQANPWNWLIMGRPTSFDYQTPKGCGASSCSQEVLALGTPLLWWSATIALIVMIGYWLAKREWNAGVILLAIGAGYLPWFLFQKRTMFTFYAISFEPFLMLALIFVLNKFLVTAADEIALKRRKLIALAIGGIYLINFIYFFPIFTGINLPYNSWLDHMWLPSWI